MKNEQRKIREILTPGTVTVNAGDDLTTVSKCMRDDDIGYVLVERSDGICGVLTDRDLAVRAIAEGRHPGKTKAGDICTSSLVAVDCEDPLSRAVELMTQHAVRRLAVKQGPRTVGVISIGDLAMCMDPDSALAEISAAPSNN